MAITQTITDLPPAPQRSNPADFVVKADAHVASLTGFVNETNIVIDQVNGTQVEINTTQTEVEATQDAVEVSETNAAASANAAAASANAAANSANFQGLWVDQTGAANKPYSVYHNGVTWSLLNDLGDITTSEPSVSADWVNVDSTARITHNRYLHFYRNN